MKILIIHDRDEIGTELQRIARETAGPGTGVEVVKDVFTARDRLRADFHDLVTIDLTLPIKHGHNEASLQNTDFLLSEIFEGGEVKAPADVLGISREPDAIELVRTNIGQHMMACIHEDTAGTWREAFAAKVRYVMSARSARQLVTNSSHDVDVVLVTALDKEARPYSDIFELSPSDDLPRAKDFTFAGLDGRMRRGVLFSIGQSGQPPCGSATQVLLTQFRPKLIIMTGFCGGVAERVKFGDVVAFNSSAAWDYGKWEEVDQGGAKTTLFRPRPMTLNIPENGVRDVIRDLMDEDHQPDSDTIAAVTKASDGSLTNWKLRLRGAGSGSAVVTSLETLGQIVGRDDDIWAIDMESYAFYYACRNTPVLCPDFICIKSVADHCNGEKNSSLHDACSTISARLAHEIVTRRYPF